MSNILDAADAEDRAESGKTSAQVRIIGLGKSAYRYRYAPCDFDKAFSCFFFLF